MPKFYEIIFETGNYAVACYEDDAEANSAIGAHNERAKSGLPAQEDNPLMGPAERVNKVLMYDEHPANYGESQSVTAEELRTAVEASIANRAVGDLVSVPEITADVRVITDSVSDTTDPHDSNYKMPETGELTGWEGNDASTS